MEAQKLETIKRIIKPFSKRAGYRPDSDVQSIAKLISNIKFFQNISEGKNFQGILNEVAKMLIVEIYEPGECVINYGEVGSKFYIILLGRLGVLVPNLSSRPGTPMEFRKSLVRRSFVQESEIRQMVKIERNDIEAIKEFSAPGILINRKESLKLDASLFSRMGIIDEMKEVSTLKSGDSFGELALISDKPRAATVEAKEISVLASLSKQDFKKILSQEAERALKEKVMFLYKLPIFKGYTAQSVQKLSYYFQEVKCKKGHIVYKEGSQADKMHFVYEGEFKLFNTKDHSTRKLIDFPSGFISERHSLLKTDKAREVRQEFQLQFGIKGKSELFGYEEYLKNLTTHIHSCVCITNQGILYTIKYEDFRARITDAESLKFLKYRFRRDAERHSSMDNAQKIVEKMITNNSRSCFSRCSSRSSAEESAKRLLTNFHPKKVSTRVFKPSSVAPQSSKFESSYKIRYAKDSFHKPKRSIFIKKEPVSPSFKISSRLKRLPPPNFMKVSRLNIRRSYASTHSAQSSRRFRNVSTDAQRISLDF